jgi:anti-sigma-K factor RskA
VVLTALAPVPVPAGKTLELWIQPPDAKAPRSLGVLPAAGRQATLPAVPAPGTALSVTLEPSGGSPTGAPTGRVVYAGTLRRIRQ